MATGLPHGLSVAHAPASERDGYRDDVGGPSVVVIRMRRSIWGVPRGAVSRRRLTVVHAPLPWGHPVEQRIEGAIAVQHRRSRRGDLRNVWRSTNEPATHEIDLVLRDETRLPFLVQIRDAADAAATTDAIRATIRRLD